MPLAEFEAISRCEVWNVFGTGTWSSPVIPVRPLQKRLAFAFLYKAAEFFNVPFRRLIWVLRHEHGEKTDRQHYHWLLGGSGWKASIDDCFRLMAIWDGLPKCGYARCKVFDRRQNGVEYVSKCLENEGIGGGSLYELNKFQLESTQVTLSDSLHRLVGGRRVSALRCL